MLSVLRQVAEVALLLHLHECLLASLVHNDLDDGVDFAIKIEDISLLDVRFGIDTGLSRNVIVENVAGDSDTVDLEVQRDTLCCFLLIVVFVELVIAGPSETVDCSVYAAESGTGIAGPRLETVLFCSMCLLK